MKRKYKRLILSVIMVVTIILTFNGCFSAPKETALMKEAGIEISTIEYKIRLSEFGYRFVGIVELSADEIISKTSDAEIKKQALLWKIYAIPAMIRSLSINDPLAAGIDAWILSVQMLQYFEDGYGKDLFGEYQDIAITLEQYSQMLLQQRGYCKICGLHQSELNKALAVDHCHETGEIRGLLCSSCNLALSYLQDSSKTCEQAAKYLREYNFQEETAAHEG